MSDISNLTIFEASKGTSEPAVFLVSGLHFLMYFFSWKLCYLSWLRFTVLLRETVPQVYLYVLNGFFGFKENLVTTCHLSIVKYILSSKIAKPQMDFYNNPFISKKSVL